MMNKMDKTLGAVHTHTHTHTIILQNKNRAERKK